MENIFIIEPIIDNKVDNEDLLIAETTSLVKTAGGTVKGWECVHITKITPSTFIGKGKIEEIKLACEELECNLVVFDGDLSPSQTINLSDGLGGIRVIDRTTLILDIFALSAKTSEGKIQVELAQLKYFYPRLKGKGSALSRLGGGIGTRGPGETKLETDRRHIRRRMNYLESRLDELKKRRDLQTDRRKKNGTIVVSVVGYTNTGKSTLMNTLTGSEVLAENKLFATLDTTVRKLKLEEFDVMLVDTVGFIKNIPTTLIEAFASTLEAAVDSDINLILVDSTDDWRTQLDTTIKMLDELGAKGKRLIAFNKCENIVDYSQYPKNSLFISAKNGIGLDNLKTKLSSMLKDSFSTFEFLITYEKLVNLRKLLPLAYSEKLEYGEEAVKVSVIVAKRNAPKFKSFIDSL